MRIERASRAAPRLAKTGLLGMLGVALAASLELSAAAPADEPAEGFRRTCERELAPTQVTVTSSPREVLEDHTRSITELTRMQEDGEPAAPARAIGLTRGKYRFDSSVRVNVITDPATGLSCMRPNIEVTLGITPQTVYVAREFPPGTCGHQAILEHEERHVEINQENVAAAADLLRAEMTSFYGSRVFYGKDPQRMTGEVFSDIEDRWTKVARRRFEKGNDQHRAIDSPESYRGYQSMCDGELSRG